MEASKTTQRNVETYGLASGAVLNVADFLLFGQHNFVPSLNLPRTAHLWFPSCHMVLDEIQAF